MRALRNLVAAAGLAPSCLAAVSLSAFALTNPPTFAPRQFQTQQTHYIRIEAQANGGGSFSANGISCAAAATGGGNCTVKVGALPYNAFILRAYQQVTVAFNSTTTDTLSLGVSAANANELVAAQSVHTAANMAALTVVVTSAGLGNNGSQASPGITGWNATQTGANGGFDLYVKWVYTTTTAATTGQAIIVLEYIAPNDGTCTQVPMGTTAGAC